MPSRLLRRKFNFFSFLLLALWPLLMPGAVVLTADGLIGADLNYLHLPHHTFIHEHYLEGVIPFWNPYSYGGAPEFGNPEKAPMYPLHFIGLMTLGPVGMLKVKYLFHLALAAVGAYLFMRALRVRSALALPAALIVGTSGFAVTKIALPTVGDSATWIGLIAFLHLRFLRRPTVKRAVAYAGLLGVMLLMFFPQINLTLLMGLGLFSALAFVRMGGGQPERGLAPEPAKGPGRLLHQWFLPAAETALLLSLMRYPRDPVYFPEPGWRCAFSGMGWLGMAALAATLGGWAMLGLAHLPKVRFAAGRFFTWSALLAVVWFWGACLAAPQLAVTGELIRCSNQGELNYSKDEDFFTGAQAYGSVRAFVQASALATPKESVNNMALGPVVWGFFLLGVALGAHRRHRLVGFMTAAVALLIGVYMAAPGLFDVFRRLPFFKSFSGLSRYLAFISFMLVVTATLNADLLIRLVPRRRWRRWARALVIALFWCNAALLFHHQALYWRRVTSDDVKETPDAAARIVQHHLGAAERVLVDARDRTDSYSLLMFPFAHRFLTLPEYAPMRTARYDRWQRRHNQFLGVDHAHYRAGFLEPAPSPWSRASRISLFLFPPGNDPSTRSLQVCDRREGWTLARDASIAPVAWPEDDPDALEPNPAAPKGWLASVVRPGRGFAGPIHEGRIQVFNPGEPTWATVSQAWYPGWRGWVDGERAEVRLAHDFLTAIRVPSGQSAIRLEYHPLSFVLGWCLFLVAFWMLAALGVAELARPAGQNGALRIGGILMLLAPGALAAGAVGMRLLFVRPDALWERVAEAALAGVLAAAAGFACRGLLRRAPGRAAALSRKASAGPAG